MGARIRQPYERKMKILLVSSGSGSRGGGEIFLYYLGKGLSDRGHEVLLWVPAHPRMDELAERCRRFARVIRVEYRNTYDRKTRSLSTCFNRVFSRRLAREWAALAPDVVHLNKQNLEDGLDLLRAVGESNLPTVCTIHITQKARYLRGKLPWLRDWIAREVLGKYRGVFVAVQEARRFELGEFLDGRVRTRTIFNGVPVHDSMSVARMRRSKRAELGLADRDFLVLGVGRLVEQKRPFRFLEIAQDLLRRIEAARFLWVGDGVLAARWNEWIAQRGLESAISCAGWQADTLSFLAAGDLLLHVAEYEGMPLAILEAMAIGLPCAITRALAAEIPLFDDDTVLFADDPSVLALNLSEACRRRVANGARRLVEARLSLETMVDSYQELYSEVSGV
jgi:glycosyltransferase involved in cell wall biosynthesis